MKTTVIIKFKIEISTSFYNTSVFLSIEEIDRLHKQLKEIIKEVELTHFSSEIIGSIRITKNIIVPFPDAKDLSLSILEAKDLLTVLGIYLDYEYTPTPFK